jgi:hypothetical protein
MVEESAAVLGRVVCLQGCQGQVVGSGLLWAMPMQSPKTGQNAHHPRPAGHLSPWLQRNTPSHYWPDCGPTEAVSILSGC